MHYEVCMFECLVLLEFCSLCEVPHWGYCSLDETVVLPECFLFIGSCYKMVWEIWTFVLPLKATLLLACCASKFIRVWLGSLMLESEEGHLLNRYFSVTVVFGCLQQKMTQVCSHSLSFTINIKCYFACMELDHLMRLCEQTHLSTECLSWELM